MLKIINGTNIIIPFENGLRCSIDVASGQVPTEIHDVIVNANPSVIVFDRYDNIVTHRFTSKADAYGVIKPDTTELIALLSSIRKNGHKLNQKPYQSKSNKRKRRKLSKSRVHNKRYLTPSQELHYRKMKATLEEAEKRY